MSTEPEETNAATAAAPAADERQGRPSASALHRLFSCPASFQAEQALPEPEQSAAAALGTALHTHLEKGTLPEDEEEADAVAWCREKEHELAAQYLGEGYNVLMREKRLWNTAAGAEDSYSGKPDVVYTSADHLTYLVIDYKFGRIAVDRAAANLQLAGLAVLLNLNTQQDTRKRIYVAILQPWVTRTPQVTLYNYAELIRAQEGIARAIFAATAAAPEMRPSEPACRYCRAAAACPAAVRETLTLQAMQFWPQLSPQNKRKLYDSAQAAKKLAADIEAACKQDILNGETIPGLRIGNGRKTFSIKNATAAFNALATMGITAQEFAGACTVSIGKLEKVFHKKHAERNEKQGIKTTQKDSRAALELMLKDCAETTTTKGSLEQVN